MGRQIKVFLDSGVVIAATLSKNKNSASNLIIQSPFPKCLISNLSLNEIHKHSGLHGVPNANVNGVLRQITVHDIDLDMDVIGKKYTEFVTDAFDLHIIAAADLSKSNFLLTFNQRHFDGEKIKIKLGIQCMKPGHFLQYLRSQT